MATPVERRTKSETELPKKRKSSFLCRICRRVTSGLSSTGCADFSASCTSGEYSADFDIAGGREESELLLSKL